MAVALKVRTAHGNDFWRCGIKFGKDPTIVEAATLSKPSRESKRKNVPTVGDVLKAEPMLVCETCEEPKPKEDQGKN